MGQRTVGILQGKKKQTNPTQKPKTIRKGNQFPKMKHNQAAVYTVYQLKLPRNKNTSNLVFYDL